MTRLHCANCGIILTRECCWGGSGDHDLYAADRTPAVAPGVMVWLDDADALPAMQKIEEVPVRGHLPAGAISINPSDVLPGRLRSAGRDHGCCGSDGMDGPNRACANCGIIVATE